MSGFVLGQTQATATTGTLSFGTAAVQASNVGSYAINGSGLTANNGNYSFVQTAGNATALTITPATLTYTANAVNQSYGTAIPKMCIRDRPWVCPSTKPLTAPLRLGIAVP